MYVSVQRIYIVTVNIYKINHKHKRYVIVIIIGEKLWLSLLAHSFLRHIFLCVIIEFPIESLDPTTEYLWTHVICGSSVSSNFQWYLGLFPTAKSNTPIGRFTFDDLKLFRSWGLPVDVHTTLLIIAVIIRTFGVATM